ncbi:MAG TPA: type II secretion system F family protein [Phycisphaerales bacterium]|nr:type II secretion system F family protein [Phycisphaerales bacterium]
MTAAPTQPSQFFFQAMTPTGGKKFGLRAALDETKLGDDLRREQLLLLKAWRVPIGSPGEERIALTDQAALNEQLALLLSRGVPLVEALEVAASVVTDRMKAKVERMREQVGAGASYSRACEMVGGFDAVSVAVYRAAERTGDLAGAANRLAQSAKRRLAIAGKTLTVLIYPAAVCTIAVLAFLGLLVFVVPQLAEQIKQIAPKINAFSAFVFATGTWMRGHLLLTVAIFLGVIVTVMFMRRYVFDAFIAVARKIPAIKNLLLTIEMARFFSVMAAMTRTGVPLADALATATGVITNPTLRDQFVKLQKGLVEGGLFRTLVERVEELPLSTRRLLIAAERGGDLETAFDSLSGDLSNEVDTRAGRLTALLEPLLICLMFALIAPLILAIAIPMMTARTSPGIMQQ